MRLDGAAGTSAAAADFTDDYSEIVERSCDLTEVKQEQHLPGPCVTELHHGHSVVGAVASLVKLNPTRQPVHAHLYMHKHTMSR